MGGGKGKRGLRGNRKLGRKRGDRYEGTPERVEIEIGNRFKKSHTTQQHIQCWARLEARSRPGEPSKVLSAGSHPTLDTRPRKLRDVSPVRR